MRASLSRVVSRGRELAALVPSSTGEVLTHVGPLPETPDTLFLRLLGRRRTFDDAVVELLSQPERAWPRSLLQKGERLGLIEGIEMLCAAFEIELTESRQAQLATSDVEELKATLAAIGTTRHWPETERHA